MNPGTLVRLWEETELSNVMVHVRDLAFFTGLSQTTIYRAGRLGYLFIENGIVRPTPVLKAEVERIRKRVGHERAVGSA